MAVNDFHHVREDVAQLYEEFKEKPNEGTIPDYIPQLKESLNSTYLQEEFCVSICTVNG